MAILEINNVASGYGEVQILWGSSLKLEKGKLTCLVGGNGVGLGNDQRFLVQRIG